MAAASPTPTRRVAAVAATAATSSCRTHSAERGLRELGKVDLLQRRAERKTDWLTAAEYVVQYRYQLRSPFGAPRRQRGHIHIHVAGEAAS